MKEKIILFIFILISNITFACSCDWGGNFIKVAKKSDLVLLVKVINTNFHTSNDKTFSNIDEVTEEILKPNNSKIEYWNSVDLEIISILKGKENRKIIRMFGSDGGAFCRGGIRHLKINHMYVISPSLSKNSLGKFSNEKDTDYFSWGCAEYIIEYNNESKKVYGLIKGKSVRRKNIYYDFQKLKRKINIEKQ
ncbi:hypothetical protein [Aureivirga sp. CE67]|uniref:hypothetical protein n=1 Tax=Aureivirga sp. CE67 TaxID=1788983 RepID=UPI0018CAD266|nr:hypothetical protein [Aureivirga sp. CE67]